MFGTSDHSLTVMSEYDRANGTTGA